MDNVFTSFLYYPPVVGHPEGPKLQWSLDPVFRPVAPIEFFLEISETPDFSVILKAKSAGDNFYAIDDFGIHKTLSEDYYYRVKLTTGDGKIYYSKTLRVGATPTVQCHYKKAAEIMRKELLRMRKYTGFDAYLLKRKNMGLVADMVDEISGVPLADNTQDYGTGIVGGYYSPLAFMLSREKVGHDRRFKQDGFGIEENYDRVVRSVGFPNIETKDVVVFKGTGERLIVQSVNAIYFPGSEIPLIQNVSLRLLPPTDTIYKIVMPA